MRILRNREVPDYEVKAAKPSRKKIKYEVEQTDEKSEPALNGTSIAASQHTPADPTSVPSGGGDKSELLSRNAREVNPAPIDSDINNLPILPDEVLIKILTYLSWKDLLHGVALVCKQWKRLTEDPELWRCITLWRRSIQIPMEFLVHLLKKFDGIRTIDLLGGLYIERTIMRQIGRQIGRQLMLCTLKLDDGFTALSLTNIKSISNCRWLECLYLLDFERLNDSALTMIAKSCTKLITLELKQCNKITSKSLRAVVVNCTGLKHLTLFQCLSVTSDAFLDCNLDIQLETLKISDSSETFELNFVHKLLKLKVLHAKWIDEMNDAAVSKLHNLSVLDLDGSPLTNEGFLAILRNNPSLQKLKIYQTPINDSDLAMISRSLCRSTLRHLTFDWLGSVTDVGIDNVLQNCSQLRKLFAYFPDHLRVETEQMARWEREYPDLEFRFYVSHSMVLVI